MSKPLIVFLALIMLQGFWGSTSQVRAEETFLITLQNQTHLPIIDSLQLKPFIKIDDFLVFRKFPDSTLVFKETFFACKTLPLAQPIDSVLQRLYHSSRHLHSGTLLIELGDPRTIHVLQKPALRTFPLPLKELNVFVSKRLIQNELYVDINLNALSAGEPFELKQLLLFEFLFQRFLQDRIARGRAFSESIFSVLIEESRPVYEPEIHFYLDDKAVVALIKNWPKIKTAFQRYVYSDHLLPMIQQFNDKIKLIQTPDYNRLTGFCKLILRYGYFSPLDQIRFEPTPEQLIKLRKDLTKISEHLFVLWFKPQGNNSKILEKLKNDQQIFEL